MSYGLFALASDRVGSAESLKREAELTFVADVVASEETASGLAALEFAAPYPNPARGDVMVQVGVPSAGPVRVSVFDARGREVAVLIDGPRPTGWHPLRWEPAGLASGVYLVRAGTAERQVTRRVTVVR